MELIKKSHAVSIIKTAYDDLAQDYAYAAADLLKKYVDEMQSEPAVDSVPVVHGRWERNRVYVTCNHCRKAYMDRNGMISPVTYKYCPNCGAKMDGTAEETSCVGREQD